MTRTLLGTIAVGLCVLAMGSSQAAAAMVEPQWGAQTSASTAYAPSYWTDFDGMYDGGSGMTDSYATFEDNRGSAQASAALQAAGIMPVLKAEGYLKGAGNNGASGGGLAAELYTYTGAATATLEINAALSGEVYDPEGRGSQVRARIYIFEAPNFVFCQDPGTIIYEYGAAEKASFELFLEEGDTLVQGSATFDVQPGETFVLWADLGAEAEWGTAYADAFSTLSLDFTDPTGLVALSPEPASLALMLGGLAAARFVRRRR